MGLFKKFKEGMESRREKYREGRSRREEEDYLRDVDELRRLRTEEKRLNVRLRRRKASERVGKKRREMSPLHRIGGRVLDIGANIGEAYQEGPPPKKKKKKKRKKRSDAGKPRRKSIDPLFPF